MEKGGIVRYTCVMVAVTILVILSGGAAEAGEISYGAKVGVMMANLTQTPAEWEQEQEYKSGFTGGVFLSYAFDEHFSLQPELLYTQKGVRDNLYDGFISIDLTASFDYVELPVLAIYTFLEEGGFRPFLYGGPNVSFTISSELECSASILSATVDFSSLTHVTDFGLVAGGGFEYPFGKGNLLLDARFQIGFTNVILSGDFEIDGSTQTIDEDDFKNYGFAFMVGYRI